MAIAVAAAVGFGFHQHRHAGRSSAAIAFESETDSIGPIACGTTRRISVVARNTTADTLTVEQILTSCDCLLVEPAKFSLRAGEVIRLDFTLDFRAKSRPVRGLALYATLHDRSGRELGRFEMEVDTVASR